MKKPKKDSKKERSLSVKQGLLISWRILKLGFNLRPVVFASFFFGVVLEITGSLGAIYSSAKLASYLARFVASGDSSHIWMWLWVDIAAGIVTSLGFFAMSYAKRLMYFRFVHWSTKTYLRALSTLDIDGFYNEKVRNQINKVSGAYTWQISQLSESNLDLIYSIIRFIAITVIVAQIDWWIIPVIAIFLVPTLLTERKLAKLVWFVWDQKGDERHVFWGLDSIVRLVKGQMELRSTQATDFVLRRINKMNFDFYNEQEKKFKKTDTQVIGTKLLESTGTTVGAIVLLRQLLNHQISLDHYFFLNGALFRIGGALNLIFSTLSRMQEPLFFAQDFFALADMEPKIVDKADAQRLTAATPDIVFENVSFTYPKHDQAVFTGLNLHIKPGEHLAIVGENGAGKTTLIKLLMRFYRPTSGRILIDGVDLNDIAIESLYEKMATLFQDFNHYPFSIAENITVGRSTVAPNKKLRNEAGEFSNITPMVNKYKHGWDTVLDSSFKKGVEPSGGQWQRVALARAFYRQAQLLILDEPTSAIDAKAEYEIFNNIFEHYKDRSAIIISHRFSTVRRADRIVVIDQGKILEQGSHQKLMESNGLYKSLFTAQAEGYKD
jgi:ATP-binding cassette subfamily B protein